MKLRLLGLSGAVSTNEIFRLASLFLYITLLMHLALVGGEHEVQLHSASGAAVSLLSLLFLLALSRLVWPSVIAYSQGRVLFEMACAIFTISLMALEKSIAAIPLPWLIGVAGVFPLALEGGLALGATIVIAAIGFIINAKLGMQADDWMPRMYSTLFVGILATLLARSLDLSQSALAQAYRNDRRFEAIARATRHIFMITDEKFQIMYVNPAIQEITGFTVEESLRLTVSDSNHPDDLPEIKRMLRHLRDTPRSHALSRHRSRHKNGHWVWVEASAFNLLHDPAIRGLVFSVEDISARKEAERKLAEEHALLRAVLDHNPSMIYAKDIEGRYTISNLSYQRRFGYSSEAGLRGKKSHEVFLNQVSEGQERDIYRIAEQAHNQDLAVIDDGNPLVAREMSGLWENDAHKWYLTNKYPLRDANGQVVGILDITHDVTERKEYEMRLENQALHDPLTGLPNRRYALKKIADAIIQHREQQADFALLFCDLDFFKSLNDTHGHDFGDKCLLELTRRIQAELPIRDFAARFGGNEFIILTNAGLREAQHRAEALLKAVSRHLVVDDIVVKLQASIGIALLGTNHKNPSELIRDADAAMYQAKERGRNRVEIFDAELQSHVTKRAQLDVALRFALERDELDLVYQPKVSMIDGTIHGFEILLRWNSRQYGVITPNEFIPVAENSGLIVPIGLWTLEQACRQWRSWQEHHAAAGLTMAVNVSMRQLLQPSFLSDVTDILERTGVPPSMIELELTETSAMANPPQTIETLTMLKKLGLRLALDDFGTGYSSLAYLQKLPLDVLKIDKAFIRGLGRNASDLEIVRLILALAQTMNLDIVAEGVESREQMQLLTKMGCYLGQGYAFSSSVSAAEAERMLHSEQPFVIS